MKAGKGEVQVRWMTPREYAALMGAPDYNLENLRRNQALFGFGDAVCVDAVAWVAEHYLRPSRDVVRTPLMSRPRYMTIHP